MHIQFVEYLLLFHYKSGCTNEPLYYVILTLPVSFYTWHLMSLTHMNFCLWENIPFVLLAVQSSL